MSSLSVPAAGSASESTPGSASGSDIGSASGPVELVVLLDEDGTPTNYHDSSSGLSGGQAQKLVFFCLAAALRFQLADIDADVPRYGTVVLDEAFDRMVRFVDSSS